MGRLRDDYPAAAGERPHPAHEALLQCHLAPLARDGPAAAAAPARRVPQLLRPVVADPAARPVGDRYRPRLRGAAMGRRLGPDHDGGRGGAARGCARESSPLPAARVLPVPALQPVVARRPDDDPRLERHGDGGPGRLVRPPGGTDVRHGPARRRGPGPGVRHAAPRGCAAAAHGPRPGAVAGAPSGGRRAPPRRRGRSRGATAGRAATDVRAVRRGAGALPGGDPAALGAGRRAPGQLADEQMGAPVAAAAPRAAPRGRRSLLNRRLDTSPCRRYVRRLPAIARRSAMRVVLLPILVVAPMTAAAQDVRLSNDGVGAGYVSAYTLATGIPYSDAVLAECSISRGRQNEPAVAVDPRDPNVLIGSSNDYCGVYAFPAPSGQFQATGPIFLGYYRSENGGRRVVHSFAPGYPRDA